MLSISPNFSPACSTRPTSGQQDKRDIAQFFFGVLR